MLEGLWGRRTRCEVAPLTHPSPWGTQLHQKLCCAPTTQDPVQVLASETQYHQRQYWRNRGASSKLWSKLNARNMPSISMVQKVSSDLLLPTGG